jgi:hypothetical protein
MFIHSYYVSLIHGFIWSFPSAYLQYFRNIVHILQKKRYAVRWLYTGTESDCIQLLHFIECDIIHLLQAGEGNMKIYSPKSIIFSEGNARGE